MLPLVDARRAGQRDDGFYGDIQSIFDLLRLRNPGKDSQGGFNLHLMALEVPRAEGVTGTMRCEIRPHTRTDKLPLADRGHIPNTVADLDDPQARLMVREHGGAAAVDIPRSQWRFADSNQVHLEGGFTAGAIYDVIYRSANPPIVGLSFLAVRDAAAWLRWGSADDARRLILEGIARAGGA